MRSSRALSLLAVAPLVLGSLALAGASATAADPRTTPIGVRAGVVASPPDTDLALVHLQAGNVDRFGTDGTVNTLFAVEDGNTPLAADSARRLYMTVGRDVVRYDKADGSRTVLATLPSLGQTVHDSIAVDRSGTVYVTGANSDASAYCLYRIKAGEHTASTVTCGPSQYAQIGTDDQGNVLGIRLWSDGTTRTAVDKITPSGQVSELIPDSGPFTVIGVLPDGSFYLVEYSRTGAPQLRSYTAAGAPSSVVGSPILNNVYRMTVDRQGNAYVATAEASLIEVAGDGRPTRTLETGTFTSALTAFDPRDPTSPPATPTPGTQPSANATLHIARHPHTRGHQIRIHATGFDPGETYEIRISGLVVARGTADATGSIDVRVRVPYRAHKPKAMVFAKGATHKARQLIRIRPAR